MTPGLYDQRTFGYNGGGWIASLQSVMQENKDVQLALAFVTGKSSDCKKVQDGTTYYPVYRKPKTPWQKWKYYYGGYKKIDDDAFVDDVRAIVEEFQPDVVHIFGLESPFATVLGKIDTPQVVHLQGLLHPYNNAFFPINLNESTFRWPFSVREWIIRNGYLFAKKNIAVRAEAERKLFKRLTYCMGRTEWDYEVSRLFAPQSAHYQCGEVLRSVFYEKAGMASGRKEKTIARFVITSTISETVYKGLDVILKTAALLKSETSLDFEWRVVGIKGDTKFVRFFEHSTKIDSAAVNVKYLGTKTAEQLADNLLDSDVYVHPSYIDNSPNSVCEAQMLGLPVVACFVGGVPSLIEDHKTGYLVPANAPYELAYRVRELAAHPEECASIGKQASEMALQRHDKGLILNQLLGVYRTILQNTHSK